MNWTATNQHDRFKHDAWEYLVQHEELKLSYHDWVVAQIDERTSDIRALNDKLRRGQANGTISFVGALAKATPDEHVAALQQVQTYAAFDPGNDPYNEHDFGSFEIDGQKYMWKIDYYNMELDGGSEDPADPTQTHRVLSIFYAEDY